MKIRKVAITNGLAVSIGEPGSRQVAHDRCGHFHRNEHTDARRTHPKIVDRVNDDPGKGNALTKTYENVAP